MSLATSFLADLDWTPTTRTPAARAPVPPAAPTAPRTVPDTYQQVLPFIPARKVHGHADGPAIADIFCGGGGASEGIRIATGHSPHIAVNHNAHAIATHAQNHADADHYQASIYELHPRQILRDRPVALLWASPSCTHFSKAKGDVPVSRQERSMGWMINRWAGQVRPDTIIAENVAEWRDWGPVRRGHPVDSRKGAYFGRMIEQLEQLGYAVDHRVLNAADYGAPTSRERLFLVAQRDGQPIRWPAPTHGAAGQQPHRTVADCIDWSDLGRSIFGRTKDLAPATCTRIARGLQRQVLDAEQPFLVPTGARSAQEHPDAAYAFIAKHYSGVTGHGVQRPLGTITTRDHHSLVTAHTRPLGQDPTGEQRVAAFIMSYYSGGGTDAACSAPLPTIVTKARHALVCVDQRGQAITDIRMRMLKPEELQRAQGFPEHYRIDGTNQERIARIGNSVCPPMAAALVAANCPALCQRG